MKKIFISYSHKDVTFKDRLVEQLEILKLAGICQTWDDSQIETGTSWFKEIETALNESLISVLMVSQGFMESTFIMETELPVIKKRKETDGLIVLPIFVNPCDWRQDEFIKEIQGFPSDGTTLADFDHIKQDELMRRFAHRVAENLKVAESKTTFFTPLPPRLIQLIGRKSELAQLEKTFDTADRVVLVNGLGGIGKTEVCKTFFYTHYNRYCYAAWVDWLGSVKESLVYALGGDKSKFIQAGEKDTEYERFEKIMDRLGQMQESFLLVLDNIENPEDQDLATLASLPQEIKILASSRCHIEGYEEISLDFLSPGECKELFYRYYKGKRDDEGVEKVVALCGYHTLTVELLARTAYHSAMSIGTLYEALKSKGFNLNEVTGGKISTFWRNEKEKKTFFDHLVKVFEISGVTEGELAVLVNVSVLPSVYIKMESVREWLELGGMDELNALVEKGWFRRDEESHIYMHPVMQEVVRYRAKPGAETCRVLIGSLANKLSCESGDNPLHKKEFLIFGEAVVRGMDTEENDKDLATLANNLSLRYQDMEQLDRALEFQLKTLKIFESVLDPNHPNLAMSYSNISAIYEAIGKLESALEFQNKALKIREEILDENHSDLATSYHILALIYLDMGQLDRALEFQLKALKIFESVLDQNHPNLAKSYNNAALILRDMGQLDHALEFQLKDLIIWESVLDTNHPQLAKSYNNAALILRDMGHLDQALEFQLKANRIYEAVWDNNHPLRAKPYNNVAMIYLDMGQLNRALEFQLKALKIGESVLAPNHSDLALSYNNAAMIYRAMGQLDRALEFQLKALKIRESVLNPNHPDLATSYNNLSTIYYDMNDYPAAFRYAEKAVAILEKLFPAGHPNLDKCKKNRDWIKTHV